MGTGRPRVDLEGITELDDGFLIFPRLGVLLPASEKLGLLFCGIRGAGNQNQRSRGEANAALPERLWFQLPDRFLEGNLRESIQAPKPIARRRDTVEPSGTELPILKLLPMLVPVAPVSV